MAEVDFADLAFTLNLLKTHNNAVSGRLMLDFEGAPKNWAYAATK